jgi:hypothetical protein
MGKRSLSFDFFFSPKSKSGSIKWSITQLFFAEQRTPGFRVSFAMHHTASAGPLALDIVVLSALVK